MVSLPSVKRLETITGTLAAQEKTVVAIEKAFAEAGVTFKTGINFKNQTATYTVTLELPFILDDEDGQDSGS